MHKICDVIIRDGYSIKYMDFLEMANDDRAKMGKDTCLQNAGKHVADKRDSLRSGRIGLRKRNKNGRTIRLTSTFVLPLNLRTKKIKFVKWKGEKIILIEYILFKYIYIYLLSKRIQIINCY